jgi:hypothetical protein
VYNKNNFVVYKISGMKELVIEYKLIDHINKIRTKHVYCVKLLWEPEIINSDIEKIKNDVKDILNKYVSTDYKLVCEYSSKKQKKVLIDGFMKQVKFFKKCCYDYSKGNNPCDEGSIFAYKWIDGTKFQGEYTGGKINLIQGGGSMIDIKSILGIEDMRPIGSAGHIVSMEDVREMGPTMPSTKYTGITTDFGPTGEIRSTIGPESMPGSTMETSIEGSLMRTDDGTPSIAGWPLGTGPSIGTAGLGMSIESQNQISNLIGGKYHKYKIKYLSMNN